MSSELGKIFLTERQSRNLSIQDVSSVLRIHPRILIALEEGDKKSLPALTFVKGFVRNYAFYLKVPIDVAMDLYAKEYLGGAATSGGAISGDDLGSSVIAEKTLSDFVVEAPQSIPKSDYGGAKEKQNHPVKFYLVFGLSLILIVLTGVLVSQFQNRPTPVISENPVLPVTPELQAPTLNTEATSETTSSALATAPAKSLDPTPSTASSVSTPAPAAAASPALVAPSLSTAPTSAAAVTTVTPPIPAAAAPPTPVVKVEPPPKLPEKPDRTADKRKSYEIVVETQKAVQLEFSYDGKTFKKTDLAEDSIQTFTTKNKVFLKTSDGGAILVSVNGVHHKTKGEAGVPLEITIP